MDQIERSRVRQVRPFSVAGWVVVVCSAVILLWSSVPVLVAMYDLPLPLAFTLATLQCASIPLSVPRPRSALLLQLVCLTAIGTATRSVVDEFWPVPVPSLLALTVVLVVVGRREPWYVSVSGWWLSFLCMTLSVVTSGRGLSDADDWGVNLLVSITVTLIALAVSVAVGQRHRMREIVAAARRDVELEQARRETVEERARIARELHDVVAHSMSIVHIQAESARFRVSDLDAAQREFLEIARSARSALGEMRQLLGALRPEHDDVLYAPQPSVEDVANLVRGTERVGSPVTYTNEVAPGSTSPLVGLTVYRIVQEALSNVVRHAPHARVVVELRQTPTAVVVTVANDAPPRPAETSATAGRSPETGGQGLRGMRERVALLRGEVVQQPSPSGGFLVHATIPTGQEAT